MRFVLVLSLLWQALAFARGECDTFKKVTVTAIPTRGKNFEVTIENGCISADTFPGKDIRGLYAKRQVMPLLQSGSIKDLRQLEALSFDECAIEKVEAGAFKYLPRISEIFLVRSRISDVPRGAFNDLTSLNKIRLQNNSIASIQKGAFAGLPALRKVTLANNRLEEWDPDWFINSTSLEKLDFEANAVRKIPKYAFANLPKLSVINFNFNNISVIEAYAFEGIRQLKYLGLRHNRLSAIDPDVFPNAIMVNSLFIDANKLNYLSRQTLTQLTVKNITLDGNPWSCPCLEDVALWLGLTGGKVKASKYCKGSDAYQCVAMHYECKEMLDEELTMMYYNVVKHRIKSKRLNKNCARLN